MPSRRKPYNDRAGYVASLRSARGRGWVVIYDAPAAGIDAGDRWVVSCETHSETISAANLPAARQSMKAPGDWCSGCAGAPVSTPKPARVSTSRRTRKTKAERRAAQEAVGAFTAHALRCPSCLEHYQWRSVRQGTAPCDAGAPLFSAAGYC